MAYLIEAVAPIQEPLLLPAVKLFLRVNTPNDDDYITDLIQSAREEVEGFTGRSIVNKGYIQALDSFPYFVDTVMSQMAYPPSYYSLPRYSTTLWNYSQMIKLLRSPLQNVTRITYSDSVTQEIDTLYPSLFNWQALTEYFIGDQIEDSNGNVQTMIASTEGDDGGTGMSGAVQPTWNVATGGSTTDSMLTWQNSGPPSDSGDFVYDSISVPPRIFPNPGQTWPPVLYVPNAVQIHFTAGYGNDGNGAPAALRQAMRLIIWDAYYNRDINVQGSISANPALQRLLWRWRVPDISPTRG
jgi:Phage gp6-like head-tail connector protein